MINNQTDLLSQAQMARSHLQMIKGNMVNTTEMVLQKTLLMVHLPVLLKLDLHRDHLRNLHLMAQVPHLLKDLQLDHLVDHRVLLQVLLEALFHSQNDSYCHVPDSTLDMDINELAKS